ncbi:MAG: FAD-binding protein [Devosia sp.]
MAEANRNWAGNITYAATSFETPQSVAALQAIVQKADKARALGSRHSFNRIADTPATLISTKALNRVISLDKAARTVTVEGGITYGELSPWLHEQGFALHNLASLPHISVVGAVSTATHGSGNRNGNLATAVAAMKIVTASGDIVSLKRGDADFEGAVVGLGALGIVCEITLDIQLAFDVRQNLYTDLPLQALLDNFEAISGAAYSVSGFTLWQNDRIEFLWLKNRADAQLPPADAFFGAPAATRPWHPIAAIDPAPCTEQMGVAGPSHLRLPHFIMEFQPSAGAELQSEYFVARKDAVGALEALRSIQHHISPLLMVSEIRTFAADNLWLSGGYKQDGLAFHFTWQQDWEGVRQILPRMEAALAPFSPRPHWGKLFTMPAAEVQSRYEKLGDFRKLATRLDPDGKFRNAFVDEFVF